MNKTILKPLLAAAASRQFSRHKIPCSSVYMTLEKAIRFWHLDYNPDRAQKLTSSSMSQHLSTRNISSKSMHAFLSDLANRQTDIQTRAKHWPPPLSEVNEMTSRVLCLISWVTTVFVNNCSVSTWQSGGRVESGMRLHCVTLYLTVGYVYKKFLLYITDLETTWCHV